MPQPADEIVVVDETDRTAYVFATDDDVTAWSATGAATWTQMREATDDELDAAQGATL
ncbi:hypothetical protein [Cellulosimicrobium sp. Marseille-Q4280]|uniref:hypothetical protein n=1 Tax=Cellulosimicrobium sp. Marseille-Q4280 TaxID=2937992 RepID=UPI002040A3D0|nr:hypothetical protein [Cellulosimicrobium sp. Marseille-Q4280]